MKSLAYAALLLSSVSVYACQEEGQFIATIASAEYSAQGQCLLQVQEFAQYNPSMTCPLWQSDVMQLGITTALGRETCAQMPGSTFSGYLIRPVGSQQILLD